jgi:hypothetical protein
MRPIDPGHLYELKHLDGESTSLLRFVKRVGDAYPLNELPAYDGVTSQEVLRALIDRLVYVNKQDSSLLNHWVIQDLRNAMYSLEKRAALKRGDGKAFVEYTAAYIYNIEEAPTCNKCGHICCSMHNAD